LVRAMTGGPADIVLELLREIRAKLAVHDERFDALDERFDQLNAKFEDRVCRLRGHA
jgi:hypothetical protein